MTEQERQTLDNNFTYHPSVGGQAELYGKIRACAKELATFLTEVCPASRERSLAVTKLEECVFWANASIARGGRDG